jgi:hypothetical protein
MKKTIRILSFMVLFCFAVSNMSGGANLIKTKITLTPVSWIFYENTMGIETPTTDQTFKIHVQARYNEYPAKRVKILDPTPLMLERGPEVTYYESGHPKSHAFTLKAPKRPGKHKLMFEGTTDRGEIFHFSSEVKVVEFDSFQTWVRVGGILGIALVTILAVSLVANAGK